MESPDDQVDSDPAHLLPGWSSLVILLTLFGVISIVTLFAILSAEEAHVTPDTNGLQAYGPSDFPHIDFDVPLLPAVVEAAKTGQHLGINVPPAPFSDDSIFPCSMCHEDMEPDLERRELGFHEEIEIQHGSEDRWCFDCHSPEERDRLRLVNGTLIGFDESYKLCGQCHGTIYRDWREGIHGQRRGYWNGAKSYLLCAHCHNPHDPAFEPMQPLPPPVRPRFVASRDVAPAAEEEHEP